MVLEAGGERRKKFVAVFLLSLSLDGAKNQGCQTKSDQGQRVEDAGALVGRAEDRGGRVGARPRADVLAWKSKKRVVTVSRFGVKKNNAIPELGLK